MNKTKVVIACLVTGVTLLTAGCTSNLIDMIMGPEKEYGSIIEKWQNKVVFEKEASEDALNALLKAAEAKDHDEFAENFTEKLRSKRSFESSVDEFLKAFPAGLSEAELKYLGGGAGGSSNEEGWSKGAARNYRCTLNGELYFVSVSFRYRSDSHPEELGVEQFTVMNKNAKAYHIQMEDGDPDLLCEIKSEEEMPARLIGGTPCLWAETSNPKLTADEMRELLMTYGTLGNSALRNVIGSSNSTYKSSNSAAYRHYYELQPENGEPRYAYIVCQTEYGKIYDAYVCTPDEVIYDNPLYKQE